MSENCRIRLKVGVRYPRRADTTCAKFGVDRVNSVDPVPSWESPVADHLTLVNMCRPGLHIGRDDLIKPEPTCATTGDRRLKEKKKSTPGQGGVGLANQWPGCLAG